ncbi:hypothetical protein B4064_1963 [Caldibacillus thermoamylovorans]|uniref:DUF3892 domain-containing protein n=1 Tax=Caldibacillus thermoamylovorans TaxID=35841 RepID=A0A0D0ENN4_9BACI|nr:MULTISPECIES: DUF3892 domain-containing protein [Caldibacillus]KIO67732.1 hypothetical protein B4064_1963 [Caldibacillus thermoamylovorans]KIO68518.1 hypothetical protein B4065_1597 [Caldibacillus thermoamylovorans]KIO69122.1 hypothetical protein B4166_1985 [Caldibacillus thermoamylovorans]KIO73198.1 hypothetical protein B4167_2339 [Caldibacillus thermoamylovorans]MCB7070268.1 DUF3892 domain-containing protein [Caldibacillus sp. 210928-DFI.2.22]
MEEIVAVDRNYKGEIISLQTSTGRVISYQKAMDEIIEGRITGVEIVEAHDDDKPLIINSNHPDDESFVNYPPIF